MKQCLQGPHASGQGSAQEAGEDSGSHGWGPAELASGWALDAPGLNPSSAFLSTPQWLAVTPGASQRFFPLVTLEFHGDSEKIKEIKLEPHPCQAPTPAMR